MFSHSVTKYLVSIVDAIVADQTFWAIVMNKSVEFNERLQAMNMEGQL